MQEKQFKVRAAHCDYRATEEEIYQTLRRITDPLTRAWKPIETAKKVVMKFNMMKPAERIIYFEGRRRELVDDAVCRAVLRLIKEHTTAQLVATDHKTRIPTDIRIAPPIFNYEYLPQRIRRAVRRFQPTPLHGLRCPRRWFNV